MHASCLKSKSVRLGRERSGKFLVYYDQSELFTGAVSALLADPEHLFATGQIVRSPWQSLATDKAIVEIGDRSYFLKRYNCLGGGYRLKSIFRSSRASKSWLAAWKFLQLGLPTPRPVVCLEERTYRLLGRSYLLLELISDSQTLLDIWAGLSEELRREVLSLLGTEIGKMHRLGLLHGDLNWRNLLVRITPNANEVFFADLDGCSFSRNPTKSQVAKDLQHFWRDFRRSNAEEGLSESFMSSWCSQSGFVVE